MKTVSLLVFLLSGIYSSRAVALANAYFVTMVPAGFKVKAPDPADSCGLGADVPCQISVEGTYAVGATIPYGVPYQVLSMRVL